MTVPAYYRSRQGRVYRLERVREDLGEGRSRFKLRAVPVVEVNTPSPPPPHEVEQEVSLADLRERIRQRHVVPTPEQTFGALWQTLRLDLDA